MNLNPINSRLRVPLGGPLFWPCSRPASLGGLSINRACQNPAGYWRLNETTQPAVVTTTSNNGCSDQARTEPTTTIRHERCRGRSRVVSRLGSTGLAVRHYSLATGLNPTLLALNCGQSGPSPYSGSVAYIAASATLRHTHRVVSRPGQWDDLRRGFCICRPDVLFERTTPSIH